jgi:hypothetical protein
VWTARQTAVFLTHIRDHPWYPLYHLIALLGLRRGEAAGLRWCDIDLNTRVLMVSHQIRDEHGHTVGCPPKTETSVRIIALDHFTVAVLRRLRAGQPSDRVGAGFLFVNQHDEPTNPAYLTRTFRKLIDRYESANVLRARTDWVADRGEGTLAHALEPLSIEFGNLVTIFFDFWKGQPVSAAHALIALWTASGLTTETEQLVHAHETCLRFAIDGFAPDDDHTRECFRKLYLTQLAADLAKLPTEWVDDATHRLFNAQGADKERAQLAVLARGYLGLAKPKPADE